MKKIKLLLYIFFVLTTAAVMTVAGCSKSHSGPVSPTAVTIVHAWIGGNKLVADFFGGPLNYYSSSPSISYGGFGEYSPLSGNTRIAVSQLTDTFHTVYDDTLQLQAAAIYTLYLCGQAATPDTLFTRDTIPYHSVTDSVVGIRFVNLSPGSNPVSVDIQGGANGSEAGSLSYKGITTFKSYAATSKITKYVFEIRDAVAGTLLYTYTYSSLARFRNVTLVLKGVAGGTGTAALGMFVVNNF